jgi:hypothetical protein
MTEYLDKAQKKALLHRAKQEPLAHAPGAEVQWKFEVQCKAKAQEGGNKKKIRQRTTSTSASIGPY